MKLIIAGSRSITDFNVVVKAFEISCAGSKATEIVSGAAHGADKLGEQLARSLKLPIKRFPADWIKHGKAAGPIRNREMSEYADALLALYDGVSRGTADMIQKMQDAGKPFYVHRLLLGALFNDAWVRAFAWPK